MSDLAIFLAGLAVTGLVTIFLVTTLFEMRRARVTTGEQRRAAGRVETD